MKKLILVVLLLLISFTLVACDDGDVIDNPLPINEECNIVTGTTDLECFTVWGTYLHTVVTLKPQQVQLILRQSNTFVG